MLYFSPWKTTLIWLTVLAAVVVAFPNLLSEKTAQGLPSFLPSRQMTLGLDLQGGSHILLEVDRQDILKDRLESTADEVRRSLREAGIGYTGLSGTGNTVQVRIRDTAQVEEAKQKLSILTQPVSNSVFGAGSVTEARLEETQPGQLRITLTDEGIDYRVSSAVSQSIEVVRRRVDELGTTEPIIQRQGQNRILVQVPGLQDPQRLKDLLNQTAKLAFRMVDTSMPVQEALQGRPPATSEILYSTDDPAVPYLVKKTVDVSGENLVDAQAGFDQRTNEPIVSFKFDTKGAQRFAQVSQQNVGLPFAIVLDDQVISAPVIREPILGGTGQISGNFSVQGANDLAILLRAGALPATLTPIEERTVGPGLGADSIAAGEIAGAIGAVLVVAFMFVAYGLLGFIANLALIVNVIMIIALLTLIGSTLTLPGIAGIVLTMGMAVDSNVLIYERMREEMRSGRSLIQSLDAGFSRAFGTILDANLTTLIAAIVLFYLGSGPVRGFAVTLAIGIVTTVFTAFTFTRWLVATWVRTRRPKRLPRGIINFLDGQYAIPFMKYRYHAFVITGALTLAGVVGFGLIGVNLGIDFKGGSLIEVQSKAPAADVSDIRARLSELNIGDAQVQEFGSPRDVMIRVQSQGGGENAEQSAVTLVRAELQDDYEFRRVEVVGPTVSGELALAGTIGVAAALFGILVYLWFRFEWQFAVGAIISTLHDVIMTVAFFVFTGIEFNTSSIAAVLTIVGYSLNDTVVIYDRMRETMRRYKKMPLSELIDLSLNQTLSRTILTSVSTMLALGALVIFGGEVIRSFTLAMLVGVVVGTYSSIFIGGPVLIMFKLRPDTFDETKDDKKQASDTASAKGA